MASTISANSAGGGGLVSSGDASGVLALQTAGVTALSIDASQKVTFANSLTSPTLVTPTLTTPTINSAQVPTISGTAPLYMCRAWVNFNGTGTVAIRASGNVSSITDNGVGDYTVNFTTAMPDANFTTNVTASLSTLAAGATTMTGGLSGASSVSKSTTFTRVWTKQTATLGDPDYIDVAIFR
jgi:hypothetical protein